MKKLFAFVLTLCLLCGAVALAENTTTITNNSAEQSGTTTLTCVVDTSYTVIIPSAVTIDLDTRKGSGEVVVAAKPVIENNKWLRVTFAGTANVLGAATRLLNTTSGYNVYIPYNIYKDGDMDNPIWKETSLLTVGGGSDEQKVTLDFVIADDTEIKYAGTYTDTLTFNIAIR